MSLFLSKYVNKVDKKGRVSVPAPFRATLSAQAGGGTGRQPDLIIFRSIQVQALEGCSIEYLNDLAAALDDPATPDDYRDLIETTVFGGSVQLPFDTEGRIIIPDEFLAFAGIGETATFVGRRRTFQIWEPGAFDAHEADSRGQARSSNISLASIHARIVGSGRTAAGGGA